MSNRPSRNTVASIRRRAWVQALPLAGFSFAVRAQDPEQQAVRVPLQQYIKGHETGDGATMRKAFLPTAHIEGIRSGKFTSWTVDEYCSRFTGKPPADNASWKRTIDHVQVFGDAAMARVTLAGPKTTATDFFVLLKADGEWKIANKVYAFKPLK